MKPLQMTLAERLWTYQAERFPLKKTVPLLAVFSAASVNVSALLAGRTLPGWSPYALAFALVFVLFFQMRAADEAKDAEDDRRYRPERPIPRGLVSLPLIVGLALAMAPVAMLAAWGYSAGVLLLLLVVWLWLALMTAEFFVPDWLKARPLLYLGSHMAIMPLIDLLLTGVEWQPHGRPSAGLWAFLLLSFLNGCVLEIGRKIWAPQSERDGVETYSRLWGPGRAALVWAGVVALAAAALAMLGVFLGHGFAFTIIAGAGMALMMLLAWRFTQSPDPARQGHIDAAAGFWVLLCYAIAGFWPLVFGGGT